MIWDSSRRPFAADGSIVTRKCVASSSVDVIWQTTTEACCSGNASLWTTTAGRGFPKSPAAATVTTSPRFGAIELRDRLDPAKRLLLMGSIEPRDGLRNPCANFFRTCVGKNQSNLPLALGTPAKADGTHSLGSRCGHDQFPSKLFVDCNALRNCEQCVLRPGPLAGGGRTVWGVPHVPRVVAAGPSSRWGHESRFPTCIHPRTAGSWGQTGRGGGAAGGRRSFRLGRRLRPTTIGIPYAPPHPPFPDPDMPRPPGGHC